MSWVWYGLYSVIMALLFFVLAECAVRAYYNRGDGAPPLMDDPSSLFLSAAQWKDELRYQRDSDLFWRPRPNVVWAKGLSTNSLGFRGGTFVKEKKPGVLRIATLGDSCTFSSDYPSIMQQQLVAMHQVNCEVYNFGVVGYSSEQGHRLFESDVIPYKPDILLIYFGLNDYTWAASIPDASMQSPGKLQVGLFNLFDKSYILRWVSKADHRRDDGLFRPNFPDLKPSERVSIPRFKSNLETIISSARKMGATPILLDNPLRPEIPLTLNPRIRNTSDEDGWAWDFLNSNPVGYGCFLNNFKQEDIELVKEKLRLYTKEPAYMYYALRLAELKNPNLNNRAFLAMISELDRDRARIAEYNHAIAEVAADKKVHLIKLSGLFSGRRDIECFWDERHHSASGADRIARRVIEEMLKVGIIKGAS
jgi:lysophospholipase L1-like esterase